MNSSYTLAFLAEYLDGKSGGNPQQPIQGLSSLSRANSSQIAYYNNHLPLILLKNTQAAAVLLTQAVAHHSPVSTITVSDPLPAFQSLRRLFATANESRPAFIHPQTVIADSATIGEGVSVGANSNIAEQAKLGNSVHIGSNCSIANDVRIGEYTRIGNNVSIEEGVVIGSHCIIDSGAVIGAEPFHGYKIRGSWAAEAAVGSVVIDDAVTIGANTVIVRGVAGDTCIGKGVQIDNLVQVAHDVTIGQHTAIAACAAIGAFTQIGSHCILGGASSLAAHLCLVDDVVITGMSTVNKSLSKPGIYSSGTMISEHHRWRRNAARFKRLDDYISRLVSLEKDRLRED
ncbi:UDP-3-O-[3-hydroxymyristoyl] glucosamine N-acyltransferase [Legionella birminghamensis]|uniref:UDP-3-O-[3-hydroxymyristoyl] glucosamine N-acyltransferase n=1 Tax=Legionella birminghamensis TaxID=28083 RepID=A0A378ICN5_9GAMM|nr:UDP-3-O-(3-hydroxymyristoyl)glucosamine N-acyltransferase [Legionella birminghamensis]KTC75461.1 UDP-3-O-[3-hydroxymyristoyl] glucosamine N-acyltransferase [Legionella birminghamensis]STX32686.1 UDP-3-O-[3-hydroxymyristoyl] glucosamine N-acyltransferase [Legionella birminghamensis]